MTHHPRCSNWTLRCIAALLLTSPGCANVELPKTALFARESRAYQGVDSSFDNGQTYVSEDVYHAVRRAKAENGVVLQIIGDETPARVLPLPSDSRSVYVSELLTQTGVLQELEHVKATLYRSSSDSIGGIPMDVKMDRDTSAVKPESDYALQAGDRLMVAKAPHPAMQALVSALLGE